MSDSLAGRTGFAGLVLAAGVGSRLRPLTAVRPKALCPVDGVPLVDLALDRVGPLVGEVAVNLHHGRADLEAHLSDRVHLSIEEPVALGTAGAVGALRDWIDGRATVIANADAWFAGSMAALVDGWDGERVRILVPGGGPLGSRSLIAGSVLPWVLARELAAVPSGLYETVWRDAVAADRLETVTLEGPFVDCGTPAAYLAANLAASGGASVVAPGAQVGGELVRSVCWEDAVVDPSETLVDAIRFSGRQTVLVR
jgi:N-acetyl-alpha-D-muramate 1-phosphate uridylyltransferase